METFVRSDLFRAILRTQHADLLSSSSSSVAGVPAGVVAPFAGSSAPDGWLLCNGADVYKASYPDLYSVLGTTYGTPGDALKFRLPNLVGRVVVGQGAGSQNGGTGTGTITGGTALTTRNLGAWGGDERLEAHYHSVSGASTGAVGATSLLRSANAADGTYPVGTGTTGSGSGGNMPPFTVLNYIIRT